MKRRVQLAVEGLRPGLHAERSSPRQTLQLYSSLSRDLERIAPSREPLSLYACGITPYDTTHLGHAFTYCCVDLLVRYLEHRGQLVRYVQNVTDIDDDILRTARAADEDWQALGNRWTAHFIEDMVALNVRPPDEFPRATDVIPEIVRAVQGLLQAGKAYAQGGSVYYDSKAWPAYGALSGLSREQMLPVANERGNQPDDPNKRDPLDFVLWQSQAPGEPAWDSPWGPGRPGWHIECSTMAGKHLGRTVDIHAGGGDLIFPHHESEIAQAEPLTDRPFVRNWMHIAMVRYEGQKMSKSLGNLVMVRDLLRRWSADALRMYLASHHYRMPWAFREEELAAAQRRTDRLQAAAQASRSSDAAVTAAAGHAEPAGSEPPDDPEWAQTPNQEFFEAMEADLDSPRAVQILCSLGDDILRSARHGPPVLEAQQTLRRLAGLLGLRMGAAPDPGVVNGWGRHLVQFRLAESDGQGRSA